MLRSCGSIILFLHLVLDQTVFLDILLDLSLVILFSDFVWKNADHPWMRDGEASDEPIDITVLTRMKQFQAMNKFKKVALKVHNLLSLFSYVYPQYLHSF